MNYSFTLANIKDQRDSLTGRLTFTQSVEYKAGAIIYAVAYLISVIAGEFDMNGIQGAALIISILALFLGFMPLSMAKKAGTAELGSNLIKTKPESPDSEITQLDVSPDGLSKINIQTVYSFGFWSSYYVLFVELEWDDRNEAFGITLKNNKEKEQYLEVLDSWYRAGYPVKEYNPQGRLFKLKGSLNYEDVQKIKKEYGMEW